jgi:hypothetical protein
MEFAKRITGHNPVPSLKLNGVEALHRKPKETVSIISEFSDPIKTSQKCIKPIDQVDKHGTAPSIPAAEH